MVHTTAGVAGAWFIQTVFGGMLASVNSVNSGPKCLHTLGSTTAQYGLPYTLL